MQTFDKFAKSDISYLEEKMIDENGSIVPASGEFLATIPQEHISQFCVERAVYVVPTIELIDWLREQIGGRSAIEVGSGKNGIGKQLGINSTDSYLQTIPRIADYYRSIRQEPITPPDYVERIDAEAAVRKYTPDVVIGCFVTHKFEEGMNTGNAFGPDERIFLEHSDYVHVGNRNSHGEKTINQVAHEEFTFPWLFTRSLKAKDNFISIWKKQ